MKKKTKKRGVKFFMGQSLKDLFNWKTLLLMLFDLAVGVFILLCVAVAMFAFKDSYLTFMGMAPSLTVIAQEGFLEGKTTSELEVIQGQLGFMEENMNQFVFDLGHSLVVFFGLLFAGLAFFNHIIWRRIKGWRFDISRYSRFLLTTLSVFLLWFILMLISGKIFNLKVAGILIALEVIISFFMLQVFYSLIDEKKGFKDGFVRSAEVFGKNIGKYSINMLLLLIIGIVLLNVLALLAYKIHVMFILVIFVCVILYFSWVRYYFNSISSEAIK